MKPIIYVKDEKGNAWKYIRADLLNPFILKQEEALNLLKDLQNAVEIKEAEK